MKGGLLLLLTYPPPPSFLLLVSPHQKWPLLTSTYFTHHHPQLMFRRKTRTNNRRWDSNAETFRTQKFNFSSLEEEEDDDDEEQDDDDDADQWFDILEEFIDGVWIFKVFRSFGWMLPAMVSSLLLATGPKAFLLALALPLGQSALSLVFQKVWGRTRNKKRRKGKTKTKAGARTRNANKFGVDKEEEEEIQGSREGYQTWVAENDDKNTQDSPSFGGWEELDRRAQSNTRSTNKSAQTAHGKRKTLKSKLSRGERKSEMPLLLRLLIAAFPFLGSWTKIL